MGALDMALDDVISTATGGSKGRGKSFKGKRPRQDFVREENGNSKADKLDRSLDDLVESSRGPKGFGKSWGKGKWKGDDDWGKGKGYGKSSWGKGKSFGKGKSWDAPYRPSWLEDDDRTERMDRTDRMDRLERDRAGGGSRIPIWSDHDDRDAFPRHHPASKAIRSAIGKTTTSAGGFQRIDQDDDVSDEPPRRRPGAARAAAASSRTAAASSAAKRARARSETPPRARAKVAKTTKSSTKTVKVTNIPKDLKARDVREAFEGEAGKIVTCELGKGTAHITFQNSGDARKAVEAFHKGELNGKIISVVLAD